MATTTKKCEYKENKIIDNIKEEQQVSNINDYGGGFSLFHYTFDMILTKMDNGH